MPRPYLRAIAKTQNHQKSQVLNLRMNMEGYIFIMDAFLFFLHTDLPIHIAMKSITILFLCLVGILKISTTEGRSLNDATQGQ